MMTKRLAALALATLIMATMPGVALAQEQSGESTTTERATTQDDRRADWASAESEWIAKLKARALEAIDKRLATLTELEAAITGSEAATAEHAGILLEELRASAAGLASLAGEIRAAADLETLRVLIPKIFEDYRIYAVVVPKVHLVLGTDAASVVADRLSEVAGAIGDILTRLEEAGFEVTEGYRLLDEMAVWVASGSSQAAEVAPMVIGLTPADYPGSTAVLQSAHETLQGAGSDLRNAGETAHRIGRFVKGLFGDDED